MTDLLVRLFVRNHEKTDDPEVRLRYGSFAGIVCIVLNVVLCLGKGLVGFFTGSVAIVADAVNNLADASSNIVSLLGFKLAGRPADPQHPYGHGRFEYLSALAVSVLVLVVGVGLIKTSIDKIIAPEMPEFGLVPAIILVVAILVKLWMAIFNRTIGTRIDSETLLATATDSRNDVISTAVVLLTSAIAHFSGIVLDGWVGLGVGLFILWSGICLIRETVDPLLGVAPSPELVGRIAAKITGYPGVLGVHDLMVHDYGPGRQFVVAHVEMAAEADVLESHDLIDNIEEDFLRDEGMMLTLHYDPIVTSDAKLWELRHWLEEAVRGIDERLTIHDLRTVPGPTHTNVLFDCVRPLDLPISADDLQQRICELVEAHNPAYVCKATIDTDYVAGAR